MTSIDPRIFRAYDIRGLVPEQVTADACFAIGKGFGSELRETTGKQSPVVCVGRDARTHGLDLEKAVINGLMSAGCTVLDIGETPSPINYFTICTEELDGGIQVTASHNPAQYNGLKLSTAQAHAFSGDDLQRLRVRIDEGTFVEGTGSVEEYDAITPYISYLTSLFKDAGNDLHVAIDAGNGIAGPVACEVLRAIGAEVTELYTKPDGAFPNHAADPSQWDTLKELQQTVTVKKLDAGIAFDGDGDRLGLVDERGTILTADHILLLLAKDHLQRFPGSPIVFTVSNSGILQTEITAWGGKPVMCKVGHSFVEHAMQDNESLLGGEQSGHFFCGEDYFSFDDALVAALRLLKIRHDTGKTFSELCAEFPVVYQAQEKRPYVSDDNKARVIEQITQHFQKDTDVLTLDGVRVEFGDGAWVGIRQSNTSPCISICLEARSPERLAEIEKVVMDLLHTYPEIEWDR